MISATDIRCALCPDLVASRLRIVEAKIVPGAPLFIGQSPGRDEELVGEPFVGDAGRILKSALSLLGIYEYSLANVNQCRPEHNRPQTAEEILNCRPFLVDVVRRARPSLVVLLGNIAQAAAPGALLDAGYSGPMRYVLHPAATLHDPRLVTRFKEGLAAAFEPVPHLVDCSLTPSPPEADAPTALDTETDQGNVLAAYTLCEPNGATIFQLGSGRVAVDPSDYFVFHNAKFDMKFLEPIPHRFEDTMLMAYCLDLSSYGLKDLAKRYCGIEALSYEGLLAQAIDAAGSSRGKARKALTGNFTAIHSLIPQAARAYAVQDAVSTAALYRKLRPMLDAVPTVARYYEEIEKPTLLLLLQMEQQGVLVDPAVLHAAHDRLAARAARFTAASSSLAGLEVNVRSHQSVARAFEAIKSPLRSVNVETGNVRTGEAALLAHAGATSIDNIDPEASDCQALTLDILLAREALALDSTFVVGILNRLDATNRLHPDWRQTAVLTNRLSCADPNLQNLPVRSSVGHDIRKAFIAPPGHKWVRVDISQADLRIFAHYTGDPLLMRAYPWDGPPRDVHFDVAQLLYPGRAGEMRAVAKNAVFEMLYTGGPDTLARTAGVTLAVAEDVHARINALMPSIAAFRQSTRLLLEREGHLETLLGWRRTFPEFYSPIPRQSDHGLRSAVDFRIQGTVAGLMKAYMLRVAPTVQQYGGEIAVQVHDELGIICPDQYVADLMAFLEGEAARLGPDYGLSVPLLAEASAGPSWGEQTKR